MTADDDRHSIAQRPEVIESDAERAPIEAANALQQFDAVLDEIDKVARDGLPFRLRPSLILGLHRIALQNLSSFAGVFRPGPVSIGKSKHSPPDAHLVAELVEQMCDWINENLDKPPLELCAYAMWRLNWIHPFEDGNGRTSRAVSYLVLCSVLGDRLPGRKTIPEQIAENKKPYYEALEKADEAWADGQLDLSVMVGLLEGYLATQLKSVFDQASMPNDAKSADRRFH
ncbi:Fic family protein [Pelagibius sp.]|uniref:Fic family protein n=1 Tax=Pelagibius sp. TaxID=1931238 RepID=UPI002617D6CB|nr:Fic family protein [Pelagibius sp.]